jgi:putative ABC transport system permease protein
MTSRPLLLRLAARSVRKNWRHSVGSMLAIAVGFLAISLFAGYLAFFKNEVTGMMAERFMMGSFLVEKAGASEAITEARPEPVLLGDVEQAFVDGYLRDHAAEVEARVRVLFIWGFVSTGSASTNFAGWGYDPVEGATVRRRFAWDTFSGRPLHLAGPDSVQLSRGLAGLLDCMPTSDRRATGKDGLLIPEERPFACKRPRVQLMASTATGQVNAIEPTVVGLVDAGRKELDLKFLAMPLAQAQRLRNTRDLSLYSVQLRDPSTAGRFSRELVAAGHARGVAIAAMPWQEHYLGEQYRQGMQVLGVFRALMAVVVVVIAGMAVFTTMVKAVSERTREIGTLRSLGFLRSHVVRLFALEAALLSAGACAVGLAATLVITAAVNGARITYNAGLLSEPIPLGISMDPTIWLLATAFLVAIAVFAAFLPARRAARARIPDALSHS